MTDNKPRVGFVGVGIMGGPMAANAMKAGYSMTVFDLAAEKTEPLGQAGAVVASSGADAAANSDIVILCVPDTPDVLAAMLDEKDGIVAGVRKGALVVDCSTVSPAAAPQCTEALAAKGAAFLDAPLSGGDVGAKAGTLSIMVGGEKADFDRALPVLQTMGKTITYCGKSGAGYTVKLCNQILCGVHLVATAEALSLATAAGVDLDAMLAAVSSGAANSWMLANVAPKMIAGDFDPGFFVDYQLKDLNLAHDAAHALSLPLPAAALAETLFRAASAEGFGRDGTQAVYKVLCRLKGD